jgi:hypothetical protein
MTVSRRALLAALVVFVAVAGATLAPRTPAAAVHELPARLSDQQFWALSTRFSEAGGTFHSDNFVSNEGEFQTVIPDLLRRTRQDGVYLGVGPEQNFTYIAAVRPRIAFIVEIRRGNLQQHLLYKALFEMSATRAEFVGRLFSRDLPPGAGGGASASAEALFAALAEQPPSTEARYRENLLAVTAWLTDRRGFPLAAADLEGIDYIYRTAFFADGPDLNYRLNGQPRGVWRSTLPTYADLMALDDGRGVQRSYLASEAHFAIVKALQSRNLVVPVVGDFAGPTALRAVGQYAREHGATVTAFYLSNVEQYLRPDGKWGAFCANVAALPLDDTSTFIRSERGRTRRRSAGPLSMFASSLGPMRQETEACAAR